MSEVMLTGKGNWTVLKKDSIVYSEGFGFVKQIIIDQHFVERKRFYRLLALTIELRQTGVGIDRETAIWIKPNREIQVFGKGPVLVIRTNQAKFPRTFPDGILSARGLILDIYNAGEAFRY